MSEPFDAYEYAAYLRARWRFFAIACGCAAALALLIGLLLPKQYTATVNIVIEPAGGSRSASVVSPVYLESLRTYETFASSGVTFERAVDRFHVRQSFPDASMESLQRKILEVTKLRDTRILQIAATLPDPRQALAFAQYIAEQTILLNQSLTADLEGDSMAAAAKELAAAKSARDRAEAEWAAFSQSGSIDTMQYEMSSLVDLKSRLNRQMMSANVDAAALRSRSGGSRNDLAEAEAKAALLEKQYAAVEHEFERKNAQVSRAVSRRDLLQDNLDSSRKLYEGAETKAQEIRGAAGLEAERLKIVDPGAVPSRPSSPKILRNVEAALLLALIASAIYLSFAYTANRRNGQPAAPIRLRA